MSNARIKTSSRASRILTALAVLVCLALPVAAQAAPVPGELIAGTRGSFLALLWDRLTAPLVRLWAADEEPAPVPPPPPAPPASSGTSDRGGTLDPFG